VIVVSNTSPITSLSAIGYVNLLHDIYGTIIVPSAVYEEMTNLGYSVPGTIEVKILSWIEKKELTDRSLFEQLNQKLHRGESETIALAITLGADRVIMDGEHLNYAMSINAQAGKKAFVGTILVLIRRCARTFENL
jgi:uncharacterized protein